MKTKRHLIAMAAIAGLMGIWAAAPAMATPSTGWRETFLRNGDVAYGLVTKAPGNDLTIATMGGAVDVPSNRVRAIDPAGMATVLLGQASDLLRLGRPNQARTRLRQALALKPDAALSKGLDGLLDNATRAQRRALAARRSAAMVKANELLDRLDYAGAIDTMKRQLAQTSDKTPLLNDIVAAQFAQWKANGHLPEDFRSDQAVKLRELDPASPVLAGIQADRNAAATVARVERPADPVDLGAWTIKRQQALDRKETLDQALTYRTRSPFAWSPEPEVDSVVENDIWPGRTFTRAELAEPTPTGFSSADRTWTRSELAAVTPQS